MTMFSLEADDGKLTFTCTDEKIFHDVYDYILRYLDAENYRRMLHPVETTRY